MKVGANRLMEKCLELRSNFSDHSPINWKKKYEVEDEDSDVPEYDSEHISVSAYPKFVRPQVEQF